MKDGENDDLQSFLGDVSACAQKLMTCMCNERSGAQLDVCQLALYALGSCLYQQQISSILSQDQEASVVRVLCDVIKDTMDKNTCARAF